MLKEEDLKRLLFDLRRLWINNGYEKFVDMRRNLILGRERIKLKDKDDFKIVIRALNFVLTEKRRPAPRIIHRTK